MTRYRVIKDEYWYRAQVRRWWGWSNITMHLSPERAIKACYDHHTPVVAELWI